MIKNFRELPFPIGSLELSEIGAIKDLEKHIHSIEFNSSMNVCAVFRVSGLAEEKESAWTHAKQKIEDRPEFDPAKQSIRRHTQNMFFIEARTFEDLGEAIDCICELQLYNDVKQS